jgi:hypothetical protein
MAGKLRFLDSREDEQERGITMESSAVSLRLVSVSAILEDHSHSPVCPRRVMSKRSETALLSINLSIDDETPLQRD